MLGAQMPVVMLDHAGVAMPEVLATTISGTPFITASEAQVWRRPWKVMRGVMAARAHASSIGRHWTAARTFTGKLPWPLIGLGNLLPSAIGAHQRGPERPLRPAGSQLVAHSDWSKRVNRLRL